MGYRKSLYSFVHIFFDFNVYSSLLLPAFIHGLLFGCLAIARYVKERQLHDGLLGLLLILLTIRISFWMLGFAGWYDTHNGLTTFMFYFPFNTLGFVGPCLYFFFLSLTNRNFKIGLTQWPHFIFPALLVSLYIGKFLMDFLWYHPFPHTEAFQFGTHGPYAQWDKSDVVYIVSYASLIFYSVRILLAFRQYNQYLLQYFSDSTGISLRWLKQLLLITIAALGLTLVFYVLCEVFPGLSYIFNWYPYFILGLAIYYTAINGYFNSPGLYRYLNFEMVPVTATITAATTALPLPNLASWRMRLQALMAEEQPFLDAELNLTTLAKKLDTTPQLLSKLINDGFKLNFNDYINQLRVEEVIKKLHQNDHHRFSLLGIAYDCGFNSKTTFNRAFKKVTGKTPTDFIATI